MKNQPIQLTSEQFEIFRQDLVKTNPPAVMDVKTLAFVLGISKALVRAQAAIGTIPCRKAGDRMLFYRDEVLAKFGRFQ